LFSEENSKYCRHKATELETGDDQGSQSGQILAGILNEMQGNLLDVDGEVNSKEGIEEQEATNNEKVIEKK